MAELIDGPQLATGTDGAVPAAAVEATKEPFAVAVLEHLAAFLDGAPHDQTQEDALSVLGGLVSRAVCLIGHADWASVTVVRSGVGHTIASSHPEALQADELQYRLRSGPCIDAARDDNLYVTGEIHHDPRWPAYGPRVHEEVGVTSVLAYRLVLLDEDGFDAALNIYSRARDAFDDDDTHEGLLLATQCALLVSLHLTGDRCDNLVQALGSNRGIGVAMGILMVEHHLTQQQAFDLLRLASQDMNRRVTDLAIDVVETGELPRRRRRR